MTNIEITKRLLKGETCSNCYRRFFCKKKERETLTCEEYNSKGTYVTGSFFQEFAMDQKDANIYYIKPVYSEEDKK